MFEVNIIQYLNNDARGDRRGLLRVRRGLLRVHRGYHDLHQVVGWPQRGR